MCHKFTALGVGKALELLDEVGRMHFKEFKRCARHPDGKFETPVRVYYHIEQCIDRRTIGFCDRVLDICLIGKVIKIVMVIVDVKKTITLQIEHLMYLKVETDCLHNMFVHLIIICNCLSPGHIFGGLFPPLCPK